MRMGPVLLRMIRGCPEKRQNNAPAMAVPRKLSITPWGHERRTLSRGWSRHLSTGLQPNFFQGPG